MTQPSQSSRVPNPENPWEGALNEGATAPSADELRRAVVGKRIADVALVDVGTDEELVLTFEDGTAFVVQSWDYEGYRSGLYLHRIP